MLRKIRNFISGIKSIYLVGLTILSWVIVRFWQNELLELITILLTLLLVYLTVFRIAKASRLVPFLIIISFIYALAVFIGLVWAKPVADDAWENGIILNSWTRFIIGLSHVVLGWFGLPPLLASIVKIYQDYQKVNLRDTLKLFVVGLLGFFVLWLTRPITNLFDPNWSFYAFISLPLCFLAVFAGIALILRGIFTNESMMLSSIIVVASVIGLVFFIIPFIAGMEVDYLHEIIR